MREWGFGAEYRYAHDFEGGYVDLDCMPEGLAGVRFYSPTDRGYEAKVRARMQDRGQVE